MSHMTPFWAELIGTAIVILFGNGVVANCLLNRTKGNGGGVVAITIAWGLAVFVGVFCSTAYSGAHLNPAVTIAMAVSHHGGFGWSQVPIYIAAQLIGATVGQLLVYLFYADHFAATPDADLKMACFCTSPAIRNLPRAFFCEAVGTFMLVFPIFLMSDPSLALDLGQAGAHPPKLGLGALGALPVGLLIIVIGLGLGGTTGYAINPVRDFCPRLVHALLPIPGKRDSDWRYAWVPIVGPIVGGLVAAGCAGLLGA